MDPKEILAKLQEGFDKLKDAFEAKVDKVSRDLTATHSEIKTYIDTKLTEVQAQLETQKAQILSVSGNRSLPGVEKEKDNFSYAKAFRGIYERNWDGAGLEKEIYENMIKRTHTAGDGTSGGYLIPTELADFIVEPALARMPIYGLGIRTLSGVAGVFDIPTLDTRPDGGHVGENGTPTEITYTFGQKQMTPKRAAGYCKISKRLLRLANPGTETFLRDQLQKSLAVEIHKKLINGTGANNQPIGVLNTSGTTASTDILSSAGLFDIIKARMFKTELEMADIDTEMGNLGWLTNPIIEEGLLLNRTTYYSGQTTGKGLLLPAMFTREQLEQVLGGKLATTTHVTRTSSATGGTTSVVYGDWSHFILCLWAGLELVASDVASDADNHAFIENLVFLKADQEYDCVVDLPAAFIKTSLAYANRTDMALT